MGSISFYSFMIMNPLTFYFLPEILSVVGGVSEGTILQFPELNAYEAMFMGLEQVSFLGILTVGFITMGAIANERKSGLVYSK